MEPALATTAVTEPEEDDIDPAQLLTFGVALFTICNPIGTIPIFLGVTADQPNPQQRRTAIMTGVGVFAVLAVSLVVGAWLLQFFGIGVPALKIAGFLFVSTIGWAMMTHPDAILPKTNEGSPAIVPLATPVVAGPGAIALVIAFAKENPQLLDYLWGVLLIAVSAALTAIVFFFAPYLSKLLGPAGMDIFTRVFGLILLSICVQQILTALPLVWPGLKG